MSNRRLIPAWAGKTQATSPATVIAWAHPRVGGDNFAEAGISTSMRGSSPRGRGKLSKLRQRDQHDRLIPAWAGKTQGVGR